MKRISPATVILVLIVLSSALLAACQPSAPSAAPTSSIALPFTNAGAAARATPAVKATLEPTMAALMPTIEAMMPTAPPAPKGQSVTLSQSELSGRWDGYMTIESVKLTAGTAEQQKQCDDQLAAIRGRQLPMGMKFDATASDSGSMTQVNKSTDSKGVTKESEAAKSSPYTYRGGTLAITMSDSTSTANTTTQMDGKALRTDTGFALVGTWKATTDNLNISVTSSGASSSATKTADKNPAVMEGTWIMLKPR